MKRALAAALLAGAAVFVRDASACSCVAPESTLLAPDRVDDAPVNAKIRIEIPSYANAAVPALRVHGGGEIAVRTRRIKGGDVDVLELTPAAPLAAATQYEISTVDRTHHPPVHVLGTFKTAGTASADTTAPRFDQLGAPVTSRPGASSMSSSCGVPGPWVTFDEVRLVDPGRPDAQLFVGVWLGDASGRIDETKPPTRMLLAPRGPLVVGRASLCMPHDFPFPATSHAWLGLAPIDEAGNTGAMRKVRVDLKAGKP